MAVTCTDLDVRIGISLRLTAAKPVLRRQVQGAWDLAFAWQAEEPTVHHNALPAPLLLAILSVYLLWGWVREAGVFAFACGGLLRMGEVSKAKRRDLVYPRDALGAQSFILISLPEAKTRFKAARFQSAKVEPIDLVLIISIAFQDLRHDDWLWPSRNQTLKRRLDIVLQKLEIRGTVTKSHGIDLASFRPGGATYLLQLCEDSELVRQRGRWVSARTMEIYLQEVGASTYLARLPEGSRRLVKLFAESFLTLLPQAETWWRAKVPCGCWFLLSSRT